MTLSGTHNDIEILQAYTLNHLLKFNMIKNGSKGDYFQYRE